MGFLPMESVHPLVVHFPIALLLASFVLDLTALILRRPQIHRVALWNLCLGVLGAGGAVLTGLKAEEIAKHSFEIWNVLTLHERLGFTTLILSFLGATLRLVRRDRLSKRLRVLSILLSGAMVGTLVVGAHLGGRLVYEFGVGGPFGTHLLKP